MSSVPVIGLVLLAAGASRRLGRPKQLLYFRGVSLIRRAAQNALLAHCQPVVVVLGAHSEIIRPELENLPLKVVENPEWETGMSASIRIGIRVLIAETAVLDGAILAVCDQPFLTADSFLRLRAAFTNARDSIVAASYSDQLGTPVLFSRRYFPELENLIGQGGAKTLLNRHSASVIAVSMPEASQDVDTPDTEWIQGDTTPVRPP